MMNIAFIRFYSNCVRSSIAHDLQVILFIFFLNIIASNGDIEVKNNQNRTVKAINDLEIGYAEAVPLEGIYARLVLAQPEDACSPIEKPPNMAFNVTMKWFAVIHRYPCPLQQKIGYAMQAGFDGVIIYVAHDSLKKFDFPSTTAKPTTRSLKGFFDYVDPLFISTGSVFSIPALLVSSVDGTLLVNEYLYNKGYYVFISSNLPFDINAYLMPFAISIGICIVVMFCFMVLQIYRCVRNHRRGNKHRLKKKYLKQIPIHKYSKSDQFDTCAICLEEYTDGEKLRVLPCGHLYHMKCIDPWLTKNRKVCPVCKGKVILPGMSDDSDSEMDTDVNEHSADERTPLIGAHSSEASTSNRRNYSGITHTTSIIGPNFRIRIDRSTQVNPMLRNSSLLTSVEADITPIPSVPEHSVNGDLESDPSSSEECEPSRPRDHRHHPGTSSRPSRHDVIV